jgi:RND family efflux transporter MFP subunit
MKKWMRYFNVRNVVVGILMLGALAYGLYSFFGPQKQTDELITVSSGVFIQSVSVSGKVEAARDVDLGFAQNGRVARVNVAVGEKASAGSVLAEIENGDVMALVSQREASLLVAEAELASLKAGTRSEEVAVAEADVRAKQVALEQAALSLIDEVQDAYTTADNAVKAKVDQFFTSPSSQTPQLSFSVSNSDTKSAVESGRRNISTLLTGWGASVNAATISNTASALSEAKANLSTVSAFLVQANAAVSQGLTGGSVTQATLNAYGVDVSTARTNVNTAIAALTAAETAYANANAALATSEKSLALKKAGATPQDIAAQEARVKSARAAVSDAEAQLRKTRIIAPFTGTVTAVTVKTGEVTQSNTPVISIITASDVLVESYIPEINVALVSPQDPADITLDAYGTEVVFPGFVESIDPAETVRDGASTYRMLLRFKDTDSRIRPGMTANIVITADKREGVISIPQKIVSAKDGKKFVTVKAGESYEEREVVLGAVSSLGTVEITGGLSSGEQIVVPKSE